VSSRRVMFLAFAVSMILATLFAASAQAKQDRPSRVMIIVLDQARPDTIDRYGMKNVQKLQHRGKNFPNALVGHMAAETVISHNVLTSGLFPKNMGWTNEVYRDVDHVLSPTGGYYVTSSMTCDQFRMLIQSGDYKKLQDYLDDRFDNNARFASISQKRTSACTSGWTDVMDSDDIIFQIRGSGAGECGSGWRKPEFLPGAPPAYLGLTLATGSCTNRWWTFQGAGAYGTGDSSISSPAHIYPLDGDRFVPGFTPGHVGGDNWSADAAIRVIDNDPAWRGMMVSLGGIDKLGHMWGPEDEGEAGAAPGSVEEMRHLPFIAKNADAQVGRILDALKAKRQLDDTLIVITADHAAQTGTPGSTFHGSLDGFGTTENGCNPATSSVGAIRSDCNWYYGKETASGEAEDYRDPSPAVQQLAATLGSALEFTYQDGHVAAWLAPAANKGAAADAVLDMPGVIAAYHLNAAQDDYVLRGTNSMSSAERRWWEGHGEELVDTMAASNGPDVVGLVATDMTYGVVGDHGGHTRLIQNIPMVFSGPGVNPKDSGRELRHVDVMPTILEAMGIAYNPSSLDGEAIDLSRPKP
jgi:hypothetical protein